MKKEVLNHGLPCNRGMMFPVTAMIPGVPQLFDRGPKKDTPRKDLKPVDEEYEKLKCSITESIETGAALWYNSIA
jgi:hypothetical protein